MKTPWTDNVDLNMPLPEYPRPQMARRDWLNLNGKWSYAINQSSRFPTEFDGEIVVPFSPETELSGVCKKLKNNEFLWYRREVALPESFCGKRVILHFGAVDQSATAWVNAHQVAEHVGGYTPFSADITDAIENNVAVITVKVQDVSDSSYHSRGKQKSKRGGIWYTPQSGIWQTVWMEAVPQNYVKSLRIEPDFDNAVVNISAQICGNEDAYAIFEGESYLLPASIPVPGFEAWSPEYPKLYGFQVKCGEDEVQSYFAMRKFSVESDDKGVKRLFLNNKPYYHNGLLDQGYWPDGLYTAPTDEALIYDIQTAKDMGFNMLRKHIKIEPLRWYYHCDRLGMLVWQDMINGGGYYSPLIIQAPLITGVHISDKLHFLFGRGSKEGREQYKRELVEMIEHLYNCPCIAVWVPFNEGWGQFDSAEICQLIEKLDKSRTIDHASGWHDQKIGQVRSDHVYFRKYRFKADRKGRAVLLSEFGGYNHAVAGHCFNKKDFGYKKFEQPAQLEMALEELFQEQIYPAKLKGLAASVYTQLSDVEDELNGILTYDRKIKKIAPEVMRRLVDLGE